MNGINGKDIDIFKDINLDMNNNKCNLHKKLIDKRIRR